MKERRNPVRQTCIGLLSVCLLLFLDQGSKSLITGLLEDSGDIPVIPNVLLLRYVRNTGMAFGLLQGKIPLFLCFCVLFFLAALYFFMKMPFDRYFFPLWCCIVLMCGGAAGNFFDRLIRGYVTDFIYFVPIDFPVFNLADVFVVCGGIGCILLVLFFYKDEDFSFLKKRNTKG